MYGNALGGKNEFTHDVLHLVLGVGVGVINAKDPYDFGMISSRSNMQGGGVFVVENVGVCSVVQQPLDRLVAADKCQQVEQRSRSNHIILKNHTNTR